MLRVEGSHPCVLAPREETRRGGGGVPCPLAAVFVNRKDTDAKMVDQQSPCKPPELLHCHTSYFKVPQNQKEDIRSEHAHHWEGWTAQEVYGLLDAGTFESA